MKGFNEFIIGFSHTHNFNKKIGDADLVINPFFEQPDHINRIGRVIATPVTVTTPIEEGDEVLIIHTHLLEEVYGKTGRIKGHYLIDRDKQYYRFEPNLIVLYRKSKDSPWETHLESVMVKPIPINDEEKTHLGLLMPDNVYESEKGYKGFRREKGVVVFDNQSLNNKGIYKGDVVYFKPYREYAFMLDNTLLWQMETIDVWAKA